MVTSTELGSVHSHRRWLLSVHHRESHEVQGERAMLKGNMTFLERLCMISGAKLFFIVMCSIALGVYTGYHIAPHKVVQMTAEDRDRIIAHDDAKIIQENDAKIAKIASIIALEAAQVEA